VARPSLSKLEENYVLDALRTGWISSHGEYLSRFEKEMSERCGVSHTVATANGTVALHLVLAAAGIGPGDAVALPALTYVATANAVTYCGADPVFVDVSPDTWCIDVNEVRAAITSRTRAVIAVDLYGHPADYAALRKLCEEHDLLLVSDAAESFGGRLGASPTGGLADATTFSFFGNKIITSGEGGCVTTSDGALADRMRLLRNQGMDPERRYFFRAVGFNYRMTNLAAALLCAQLERSPALLARRAAVVDRYDRALADEPIFTRQPVDEGVWRSPWMASFLVGQPGDDGVRDALIRRLDDLGVETRPFFTPVPDLPPYSGSRRGAYPVSSDISRRGINLPTYPDLTAGDVDTIVSLVLRAARSLRSTR
jgi:perosamine synthetase